MILRMNEEISKCKKYPQPKHEYSHQSTIIILYYLLSMALLSVYKNGDLAFLPILILYLTFKDSHEFQIHCYFKDYNQNNYFLEVFNLICTCFNS